MITLVTVLSFLFLNFVLFSSCQDKLYNFKPESRHIEINEGNDFVVSFNQFGDNRTIFGSCVIEGGTYNAEWPIYSIPEKKLYNDVYQGFGPYNGTGICGFVFYTVDDTVPLEWTIKAYDNLTKSYFTEKVTVTFYYNIPQHLNRVQALPKSGAINFMETENIKFKKCTFGVDNATVDLDLNSVKTYGDNNIFKSRLTSIGNGKCGFRINNLASGDSKNLYLYATDEDNKVYRGITELVIVQGDNLINRTIKAYLGDSLTIHCGSRNVDGIEAYEQKYCYLYNPRGELVSNDKKCEYSLDIVTLEDLGTWKCTVGYEYVMEALEFETELVEKKREYIVPFIEETEDYLILGCKFNNFEIAELQYCRFTRPDGKIFTTIKGAATTYYSTFTSDLKNFRCSIEILKPIRDQDKGNWKCESSALDVTYGGSFITVETSRNFPYHKYMKKNIQLGHSFLINCMVPYPSDNCHITAPNGTQYKTLNDMEIQAGYCTFSVEKSTVTDNGTWSCNIAQKNGIPDDIIRVDIIIIELNVLYANAEASEGDEIQLICNTNGIPLDYCRFVSPSGNAYSLRNDNTTFNRISYSGQGLEYGECGIQISQITQSESGQWSCHIGSGRYTSSQEKKADLSRTLELTVNSPRRIRMAESVGLVIGILAAVIAVGGFVFYKYAGRRKFNRTNAEVTAQFTGRTSDQSGGSGEAVILAVPQNSYNT